jgi:hypothetical protein
MDGMFDIFGYGMINPKERDKEKRGMFWKDKTNTGIDFTSIGGTGPLNQKGGQILPSNPNYPGKVNQLQKQATYKDDIRRGGTGINQQNTEQLGFLQRLSNLAGVDMDKAAAMWKDKGGFEGLMSNPAFAMGLAFMQAGAEGKTLGTGALDNVVKAAGISSHYKRIIEAKAGGVIEATEGQMDDIKSILGTMGISGPGWRRMLPGNQSESYEQAVEDITIKVQQKVNKMKEDAKKSGKDIVVGSRLKKKIIQDMIDSGEISKKRVFFDKTLEAKPMARGGPIRANKAYLVGEQGPEVVIPKQAGKVLSNDDSQIFAMLLAANPQLQKVSKARAEKIMRSRFPEYFE